jgi:hypothetical protein
MAPLTFVAWENPANRLVRRERERERERRKVVECHYIAHGCTSPPVKARSMTPKVGAQPKISADHASSICIGGIVDAPHRGVKRAVRVFKRSREESSFQLWSSPGHGAPWRREHLEIPVNRIYTYIIQVCHTGCGSDVTRTRKDPIGPCDSHCQGGRTWRRSHPRHLSQEGNEKRKDPLLQISPRR